MYQNVSYASNNIESAPMTLCLKLIPIILPKDGKLTGHNNFRATLRRRYAVSLQTAPVGKCQTQGQ
ncbi:MAG: hypothetical protein NTV34_12985 [Proteobacteria bacterium]|nr:hypothetical protein [Pseudomonadota bacterium]